MVFGDGSLGYQLGEGFADGVGDWSEDFVDEYVGVEAEDVVAVEPLVCGVFAEEVDEHVDLLLADFGGVASVLDDVGDALAGSVADDHGGLREDSGCGDCTDELAFSVGCHFGLGELGAIFEGAHFDGNFVDRADAVFEFFEFLVCVAVHYPGGLLLLFGFGWGCCHSRFLEEVDLSRGRGRRRGCCLGHFFRLRRVFAHLNRMSFGKEFYHETS